MRGALLLVALGASACGGGPVCEAPETVLAGEGAGALTCDDADHASTYVELLAGRELGSGDRQQLARGLVSRWAADPVATRATLDDVRRGEERLLALTGLDAAEARSAAVYSVLARQEAFGLPDDDVRNVFERAVAVWARSDADGLALTEVDIEGWILYASLCREAQGGDPLRLSVADRVVVYHDLVARYEAVDRNGRVAMSAFGAFWPGVKDAWSIASFEEQRRWIDLAPLPPPMTATSKGYLSVVVEGDVVTHARMLHGALGPFHLSVFR